MTDPATAVHFIEQLSYFGIFVSLLFSGYLLPIPEEVLLLVFGYLISVGSLGLMSTLTIAFVALLISDNIFYWLLSRDVPVLKHFTSDLGNSWPLRGRLNCEHSIGRMIFLLRFAVGLRMLSPVIASSKRAPQHIFFLYDTLALLIYTPVVILIGFYFHNSILSFITRVESVQHGIATAFFIVLWGLLFFFIYRRLYNIRIRAVSERGVSHE